MISCECYARGLARCTCGAVKDGVLVVEGASIHIPLLMKDGATVSQVTRKDLTIMTDAEKQTMRDSVPGMPLYQAAKLPLYDNVRGTIASGMPAERYYAIIDGADANRSVESTEENIQRLGDQLAARQEYVRDLNNSWRSPGPRPTNDNRAPAAPQYARDGRALSSLSDEERAREEMIIDQSNAWRGG